MFFTKKRNPEEILYVITPVFNPVGYEARYRLYKEFEERMLLEDNVVLITVECTMYGDAPKVKKNGKTHIVVRVNSNKVLWLKENLINIGAQQLPKNAKYMCWVDCDLEFTRGTWVKDTIAKLQKFPIIQMFSEVVYLDKKFKPTVTHTSLMWGWLNGASFNNCGHTFYNPDCHINPKLKPGCGWHGAPGGAWAYKVETFKEIGGLVDFGIVGSGDSYSAFALLGIVCQSLLSSEFKYHYEYIAEVKCYVKKVFNIVNGNVGMLEGIVRHYYHGEPKDRAYWQRNQILCKNEYNPITDLRKDFNGLNFIHGKVELERDLIRYFLDRKEDNND